MIKYFSGGLHCNFRTICRYTRSNVEGWQNISIFLVNILQEGYECVLSYLSELHLKCGFCGCKAIPFLSCSMSTIWPLVSVQMEAVILCLILPRHWMYWSLTCQVQACNYSDILDVFFSIAKVFFNEMCLRLTGTLFLSISVFLTPELHFLSVKMKG